MFASGCPDDLAAAVVGALRVDPRHRPSAAQLAQTLLDALESEEEALARVLAVAPPAGRPALRLVPAQPQGRADWTEHPIPDVTSEPAPEALPGPPQAISAAAVTTGPRPWALRAAAGLAVIGVAWWAMHAAMRPVPSDLAGDPVSALADPAMLASEVARPPSPTPAPQPTLLASASSQPSPPPTMLDALDGVAATLRRCSPLAGGLLMVEFTTIEQRDTFSRVVVSGNTHPDLDRCVREATADLHFQPRHAETFTKEYSP